MKVLVVGGGGREHAIVWRLKKSPSVSRIICPNGNPGIARIAETPAADLPNHGAWTELARSLSPDLTVIGPEAPLASGLADSLRTEGFRVFGPGADGAQIESSKQWSKQLMADAGIPTARYDTFDDPKAAMEFADSLGLPVVIKADGLAAGKGVTVAETREQAQQAIEENLLNNRFGEASSRILIEEFLEGEEASIFGLCDGETVFPLVSSQDHKRALEGDRGPNTGGMGAYAPAPMVTAEIETAAYSEILRPALDELRNRGIDYRGVIYTGLMITEQGPKVVEFNCRFGDPETQVVLPLLEGDFGEILLACAEGRLAPLTMAAPRSSAERAPTGIGMRPGAAITVVLASGGYPGAYVKGAPITGLQAWDDAEDAIVFHAGTSAGSEGEILTAGGRVLACTAWDETLPRATARAYEIADSIEFSNKMLRRDIGHRALKP